jgi:hypothetical protein
VKKSQAGTQILDRYSRAHKPYKYRALGPTFEIKKSELYGLKGHGFKPCRLQIETN